MKKLYAPWRSAYTNRVRTKKESSECVFCRISQSHNDAQEFVLKRLEHCMVMLNIYPYNAGHILIVPYLHHEQLHEYDDAVRIELMAEISTATYRVMQVLGAEGCNVGINIGTAAGAGIPEHLHVHVLPRFSGDTNFLPTLADTKQVSLDLQEIYMQLRAAYEQ